MKESLSFFKKQVNLITTYRGCMPLCPVTVNVPAFCVTFPDMTETLYARGVTIIRYIGHAWVGLQFGPTLKGTMNVNVFPFAEEIFFIDDPTMPLNVTVFPVAAKPLP